MNHQKQFEELFSERKSSIEQTWDLVEQFIAPLRGGNFFQTQSTEMELTTRRPHLYTDVGMTSCDNLSAALHGTLTSSTLQWFEFQFHDQALNTDVEALQWIEDCSRRTFNHLQRSNFDAEVSEAYMDLTAFGNAMVLSEYEQEMIFTVVPVRQMYFTADWRGRIQTFYQLNQWTAPQILAKFPNAPQSIRDKAEDSLTKIDVVYTIYPRHPNKAKAAHPHERPYGAHYFLRSDGTPIGDEGGFYEMPAFIARWRKMSGSRWGFGPGAMALPSVMTLDELIGLTMDSLEKAVSPANLATPYGLLSDLDLGPDGLTMVQDTNNSLRPYESRAQFQAGSLEIGRLEESIRRIFLNDQLDMRESSRMTATEVNQRIQEMARKLGSTLARLQSEFLRPLIERTFTTLARNGEFLPPPQSVPPDADWEVHLTSPLARAMRQDRAQSMLGMLDSLAAGAQVLPELLDTVEPRRFGHQLGLDSGVPAVVMRTPDELDAVQDAREQERLTALSLEAAKAEQAMASAPVQSRLPI